MKRKEQRISDAEFAKWAETCEELLSALLETTTGNDFMKHTLAGIMLSKIVKLTTLENKITLH